MAERVVARYFHACGISHLFLMLFFKPFVILDFYLSEFKLAVEVDGSSHDNKRAQDAVRDAALLEVRGIRTVRIKNSEVYSGEFKSIIQAAGIVPSALRNWKPLKVIPVLGTR
jgi:hypothetical protein